MRKIVSLIALLMMVACPLFAQGVAEIAGSAASGAVSGASFGSIFPGLGTLAGAMIGSAIGLFSGSSRARKTVENDYFNMQNSYDTLKNSYDALEIGIKQQEANLSTYDQALLRWQDQYDISRNSLVQQGQTQYQSLMNNWMETENVMNARGQAGGTADLIAKSQKAGVVSFVGKDLQLDANGGAFGAAVKEMNLDSLNEYKSYLEQRGIEAEALSMNRDSLAEIEAALEAQKQLLNKQIGKYNFWNSSSKKEKVV